MVLVNTQRINVRPPQDCRVKDGSYNAVSNLPNFRFRESLHHVDGKASGARRHERIGFDRVIRRPKVTSLSNVSCEGFTLAGI